MANDSEKKAKARVDLARAFVLQFVPSVFLFFFLFRAYRLVLGYGAVASTLAAVLGALGGLVCLPEVLGQRHFLGLPTGLRLRDLYVVQASPAAAWGVRLAAWASLAAALAAACLLPRQGTSSWVFTGVWDAVWLLVNALFLLPVGAFYISAFELHDRGDDHMENMLALCIMTQIMATFTPRGWFALCFIPPYAAYIAYNMFAGVARMLTKGSQQPAQPTSAAATAQAGQKGSARKQAHGGR